MVNLAAPVETRSDLLQRALKLEWLTVGWKVLEGLILDIAWVTHGRNLALSRRTFETPS